MTGCITFYSAEGRITMVTIEMLPVREQNYNGILVFPVIFILTPVFHCHGIDDGDILKVRTKSNVKRRIVVSTVLSTAILFLGLALVLYVWKRKQQKNGALLRNPHKDDDLGLPLFDLGQRIGAEEAAISICDYSWKFIKLEQKIVQAWRLFQEGRPKELLSESIIEACNLSQALRSIHVALLCVQENREDRPDMSYVVLMFGNEDALPRPKHPGFYIERDTIEESLPKQTKPLSENECSISLLEAR
ncbi:hypothetical protein OIU84_024286 [Salix udensis]|uniref:S-locus receptor kinase C-terminal domain-containing protein n=1 Tax=Salix udensis TaxID=889485 RepID=A0AAD6KH05_9ROSI|nr:hypothetical protein OIU84_024286 [Salix udensis]